MKKDWFPVLQNVNLSGKTEKEKPQNLPSPFMENRLLVVIGPLEKTKYFPANYP